MADIEQTAVTETQENQAEQAEQVADQTTEESQQQVQEDSQVNGDEQVVTGDADGEQATVTENGDDTQATEQVSEVVLDQAEEDQSTQQTVVDLDQQEQAQGEQDEQQEEQQQAAEQVELDQQTEEVEQNEQQQQQVDEPEQVEQLEQAEADQEQSELQQEEQQQAVEDQQQESLDDEQQDGAEQQETLVNGDLGLSEEKTEKLQKVYEMYAEGGSIDYRGFKKLLRCLGQNPVEAEARNWYSEADQNSDGTINFPEFCKLFLEHKQPEDVLKDEILNCVRRIFPNEDQEIELSKVIKIMSRLEREASDLSQSDIIKFCEDMDINGNGKIDATEFVSSLCGSGLQL